MPRKQTLLWSPFSVLLPFAAAVFLFIAVARADGQVEKMAALAGALQRGVVLCAVGAACAVLGLRRDPKWRGLAVAGLIINLPCLAGALLLWLIAN